MLEYMLAMNPLHHGISHFVLVLPLPGPPVAFWLS